VEYNIHHVLRKFVAYYTINKYDYDLKLLSFKKTQHIIYKEFVHIQKFIFVQNDKQKKFHVLGQL
jgi:hypothetical protein